MGIQPFLLKTKYKVNNIIWPNVASIGIFAHDRFAAMLLTNLYEPL